MRELWVAIQELFHANKEPRAVFLSHEFHSMTQGNLPFSDYCKRMKTLANSLRDIGLTVDRYPAAARSSSHRPVGVFQPMRSSPGYARLASFLGCPPQPLQAGARCIHRTVAFPPAGLPLVAAGSRRLAVAATHPQP